MFKKAEDNNTAQDDKASESVFPDFEPDEIPEELYQNFEKSLDNLTKLIESRINNDPAIKAIRSHEIFGINTEPFIRVVKKQFLSDITEISKDQMSTKVIRVQPFKRYFELFLKEYISSNSKEDAIKSKSSFAKYIIAKAMSGYFNIDTLKVLYKNYCDLNESFSFNKDSRKPQAQRIKLIFDLFDKEENKIPQDIDEILNKFSSRLYGYDRIKDYLESALSIYINSDKPHYEPILLVGPPGVGKTCVAESIAYALNYEFISISLAMNPNDTVRLFGTAENYTSSREGSFLAKYKDLKYKHCVILFDEIDKAPSVAQDAVSSITDPESAFEDAFLMMPLKFIGGNLIVLTANNLSMLPSHLINRCKVIYVSDYTNEEKYIITKEYLIPGVKKNLALKTTISMSADTIRQISSDNSLREIKRLLKDAIGKALDRKKQERVTVIYDQHVRPFLNSNEVTIQKSIGFL